MELAGILNLSGQTCVRMKDKKWLKVLDAPQEKKKNESYIYALPFILKGLNHR